MFLMCNYNFLYVSKTCDFSQMNFNVRERERDRASETARKADGRNKNVNTYMNNIHTVPFSFFKSICNHFYNSFASSP